MSKRPLQVRDLFFYWGLLSEHAHTVSTISITKHSWLLDSSLLNNRSLYYWGRELCLYCCNQNNLTLSHIPFYITQAHLAKESCIDTVAQLDCGELSTRHIHA